MPKAVLKTSIIFTEMMSNFENRGQVKGHKPFQMIRIVIYSSDIIILTEKSESYACKEIQNLKKALRKVKHQKVTIKEYCHYYGFDIKEVIVVLSEFELKNAS